MFGYVQTKNGFGWEILNSVLVVCTPAYRALVPLVFLRCIVRADAGNRRAGRGWLLPVYFESVCFVTLSQNICFVIRALCVCIMCVASQMLCSELAVCLLLGYDLLSLPMELFCCAVRHECCADFC
jgi:hypothetical protein